MAQKRLDRDAEIADITKQEREQLEKVRTEKTKELEGVLEQQGGENRKKLALVLGLLWTKFDLTHTYTTLAIKPFGCSTCPAEYFKFHDH